MNDLEQDEAVQLKLVIQRANAAAAVEAEKSEPTSEASFSNESVTEPVSAINTVDTTEMETVGALKQQDTGALSFSTFDRQRESLAEFLKKHNLTISLAILGFILLLFFVKGSAAVACLLMWTVVWFSLLYSQHLNSKFELSSSPTELVLRRKHWLGQETLKLDWTKVDSISIEQNGYRWIEIALRNGAVSPITKLIFQDMLNGKGGMNFFLQSERTPEEDAFIKTLQNNCPLEKLSPGESDTSLLRTDIHCKTIHYQAMGRMQRTLTKALKVLEPYLLPLGMGLTGAILLTQGLLSYVSILLLSLVVVIPIVALLCNEAKVRVFASAEGLNLAWESQRSRTIPWNSIEKVSHLQTCNPKTNAAADCLEFMIDKSKPESAHVQILSLINPHLFKRRQGQIFLSLDPSLIKDADSRVSFLQSIKTHLPAEKIEHSVHELLNPTNTSTYTQLWLDSLGSSVTRVSRRSDEALAAGMQLKNGKYEIIESLGSGGQATVYLAKQTTDAGETQIVLKEFVLPSHAGANLSGRSLDQIQSEFDLMSKISQQNIVQYLEIFVEDHRAYLVLEHIEGKTLRSIVETRGPLPESEVIALTAQMCTILQSLHQEEIPIIHRDFTPENLILAKDGTLKVIDFNVAQHAEEKSTVGIVGKHAYLPPEQFRGKACPQSDIYALGATMYYLLIGEEAEPLSCSHPNLNGEICSNKLDSIIAKSTELELIDRYKNAEELAADLEELRQI